MPSALDATPLDGQLVGDGMDEIADLAIRAEDAGFRRLWAPELYRSATIPLAAAVAATDRIEVGTGIALAFTRSPMVLALEALDLDEFSGGRFVLGLGAGVRRLNESWHAAAYRPAVARMRELVAAVRELIAALAERRDARAPGRHYDIHVRGLRRPGPPRRAAIPVWLAAVRPRMTALAGEIADGFLDHPVTSPEWMAERIRPALQEAADRAGRPRPEFGGGAITAVSDEDPDAARRAAALSVGFYATVKSYEELFAEHGFADRLPPIRRAFAAEDADRLADAVGIDMTRAFAAAGSAGEVRARLERYAEVSDRLWLVPPHHMQSPPAVARWQRALLVAFAR